MLDIPNASAAPRNLALPSDPARNGAAAFAGAGAQGGSKGARTWIEAMTDKPEPRMGA